jgi:hypothetical protein
MKCHSVIWHSVTHIFPVVFLLLGIVSCGPREEIRTYNAPREDAGNKVTAAGGETQEKKTRLLGLIIPKSAQESWFVKFSGPVEQIEPHAAAFDIFIRSIRVARRVHQPNLHASSWLERSTSSGDADRHIPASR